MVAAALFSGGKDSLYSIYLAQKRDIEVEHLISLIPKRRLPSPHAENIEAFRILTESMGKSLSIVDLRNGEGEFVETLKRLEVDLLVAGDILIEKHVSWLKRICGGAGVDLLEPLFGRDTSELFHEIFRSGFKATIISVDTRYMREEWLGYTISKETIPEFLSRIGHADPLGEKGEYHTVVIESPLYPHPFKARFLEKKAGGNKIYLRVGLTPEPAVTPR